MKHVFSILAASGLALASPQAQAQDDAAVFKPAGNWVADYGDDYCRLSRTFSNGSAQISLGMERVQPGVATRFLVVGDGIKIYRTSKLIGYSFGSQPERQAQFAHEQTADGKEWYNLGSLTLDASPAPSKGAASAAKYDRAAERATAKGVTAIVLGSGLTKPVRIETGPLDAAVGALQACADDLVKTWGLDPAKNHELASRPVPQGMPWLQPDAIDFSMFGRLALDSNQIRVTVDSAGKPTGCHAHWPTLDKPINDKICQAVMQKASFAPAQDASGQPVASYWMGNPLTMMPPMGGPGLRR